MIEKTTRLFGLLGDNLAFDKTPQLMNYLFGVHDLDAAYIVFNIRPEDLPFTLKGLRKSQINAIDIDLVYWEDVLPFCDHLTPEAQRFGLVDTIRIHDGALHGSLEGFTSLVRWKTSTIGATITLADQILNARHAALADALSDDSTRKVTLATPIVEEALELIQRYHLASSIDIDRYQEGEGLTLLTKPSTPSQTAVGYYAIACAKGLTHIERSFAFSPHCPDDIYVTLEEDFTRPSQITKGYTL